jgi:F-type H+-transporting ATPase subunit a
MPEISIKAETLFYIGTFAVKNSMVLSSLVFIFFAFLGYSYYKESQKDEKSGLYYTLTLMLRTLYDLFSSIVHDKIDVFFPLLSAFFLWILIQNWSGLLPGVGSITVKVPAAVVHGTILKEHVAPVESASEIEPKADVKAESSTSHEEEIKTIPLFRGNNADLNATLALAIISVVMIQVYGIQFLGFKTYISKFLNFKDPIYFVLGILEIVSEISKVLSFAFRLFGNIFAGEVLLTIVAFLVPVLASFPFLILEVFVGFVQALVFSMLTSVFLSLSVSHH